MLCASAQDHLRKIQARLLDSCSVNRMTVAQWLIGFWQRKLLAAFLRIKIQTMAILWRESWTIVALTLDPDAELDRCPAGKQSGSFQVFWGINGYRNGTEGKALASESDGFGFEYLCWFVDSSCHSWCCIDPAIVTVERAAKKLWKTGRWSVIIGWIAWPFRRIVDVSCDRIASILLGTDDRSSTADYRKASIAKEEE